MPCRGAAEDEDLNVVCAADFTEVEIVKERVLSLPDEVLESHFSTEEMDAFRASGAHLLSVTVRSWKPPGGLFVFVEALLRGRRQGTILDHLDGYLPTDDRIARAVDHAHPALPQRALNNVPHDLLHGSPYCPCSRSERAQKMQAILI